MRTIFYVLLLTVTGIHVLTAQPQNNLIKDVVMPAPNAAALGKYGDIPVSYFTGVPGISVPIHTVQEGPLTLPVSLSYHASGVRVNEMASWVGLGWSLNAGGMISRTVLGSADDQNGGYYHNGATLTYTDVGNVANGLKDGEPDMFSFSFGGISGKFFFDKDKKCHFVPKQDFKMQVLLSAGNQFDGFVITAPDGTRYIFGDLPTNAGTPLAVETTTGENLPTYITSWHLVRIESYDANYAVNLEYADDYSNYFYARSAKYVRYQVSVGACSSGGSQIIYSDQASPPNSANMELYVYGKRLSSITFSTGTIDFVAQTARQDIPSGNARLDKIKITSGAGAYCKEFFLSYDYFKDNTCSGPECQKLQLTQVQEKSCDGQTATTVEPYKFEYEGALVNGKIFLPERFSKAVDHWGYYNGVSSNQSLVVNAPPTTVPFYSNSTISYGSADREPREAEMKRGVLKKITYPTGGNTQFTYEANTYLFHGVIDSTTTYAIQNLRNCNSTSPPACCSEITPFQQATLSAPLTDYFFDLSLNAQTTCSGGAEPFVDVEVYKVSDNSLVGIFSFNVSFNSSGGLVKVPLSQFPGTFTAGTAYKFRLFVNDGLAVFSLYKRTFVTGYANKPAGGLRIKQIRSHDGYDAARDVVKTYQYVEEATPNNTSGKLYLSEEVTNSDGKTVKTEYSYFWERLASGTTLHTAMKNANLLLPAMQTRRSVNNIIVDGSRTDYSLFSTTGNPVSTSGTNIYPYPYIFYRYEMTWENGVPTAYAESNWKEKGRINTYHARTSAGKGHPKQFTQLNWPSETYEWENGLIKKRTYLNFIWEYTYFTGTRLLSSIKEIDGQLTSFTYDQLMRLKTASSRGGNVQTVYSYQYKKSASTHNFVKDSTTFTLVTGSNVNKQVNVQYFDGLGRVVQTVGKERSPAKKDVVQAIVYDEHGRRKYAYEPFEAATATGAYAAGIPINTPSTFFQYETNPLSRVKSVTPPGWYATTYTYGANSSGDGVRLNHSTGTFYAANLLNRTTVADPDGNKTITFTDRLGRTVLSRRTDNAESVANRADTYTLHDDKNRVTNVVPPGAVLSQVNLIFTYRYDGADNMIFKKVPGAGDVEMRYNTRDQLALLKDGLMAGSWELCLGDNPDWLCTRYDDYGRPVRTGLFTGTPPGSVILPTLEPSRVLARTYYDGTLPRERGKITRTANLVLDCKTDSIITTFTYDDHGRLTNTNGNNYLYGVMGSEQSAFTYDWAGNRLSETRTHQPQAGTTTTIAQRMNYDHWSRLRNTYHRVNGGVEPLIGNLRYDFKDRLAEKNLHAAVDASWNMTTALQSLDYTYNDQNWLTAINGPTLGGANAPLNLCPSPPNPGVPGSGVDAKDLFYLELRYDALFPNLSGAIRKNGNIAQMMWRVRGRERQAYSFTYDFLDRLSTTSYADVTDAGTVSLNNRYTENLTYDPRGNILTLSRNGLYPNGSCLTAGQIDNLTFSYLWQTNKVLDVSDAASSTNNARDYGFKYYNASAPGADYQYDPNGNLSYDPSRGLTVTYNHLNLPTRFAFAGNKTIDIVYDAAGTKLRKVVKDNGVTVYTQDYAGGIEYRNGKLESIFHAEGRVYNTNVTTTNPALALRYEYTIKDHLGNARLSFTDKDGDNVVEVLTGGANEVIQEDHYYPFGMKLDYAWMNDAALDNDYRYNGKELHDDFGLNWYAYGARWYDPAVGRFTGVDPIADQFAWVTPYNYAENEPVGSIDLHGLQRYRIVEASERARDQVVGNDDKGIIRTATPEERKNNPVKAAFKDGSFLLLEVMGLNHLDNSLATLLDPNASLSEKGAAAAEILLTTKSGKNNPSKGNSTYNRVKPRKGTIEKVTENQPKNGKGELLDPNTGQVIDPKNKDLGHKPGNEWRIRKKMHQEKGSTRKEIIEAENDPSLYQWEDRSNNRSHKYEKKNNQ